MCIRFLAAFVAITAATAFAEADRTITSRDTSAFWTQFNESEPSVDVYSVLSKLVLTTQDSNNRFTILMWDGDYFTLFLRSVEVADLTTGEDENGRPNFAGNYDATGVPQLTGFVDVTPDGNRIVQFFEEDTVVNERWETDLDGVIVAKSQCECPIITGSICTPQHCHSQPAKICEQPNTRCKWTPIPEGL